MSQEGKKSYLNLLGDRKYYSKLLRFYAWFFLTVLFLLGCVFIFDGAYIQGAIILILSIFNIPPIKKITSTIPQFVKVIINIALIILFVQSIYL